MLLLSLFALTATSTTCPDLPAPPTERGIALGLFSEDHSFSYRSLLEEIAETGANRVSLVWVWWQTKVTSNAIAPKASWTASEAQLLDSIVQARAFGLKVTVFPIVRLAEPEEGQWRGKLAPEDEDAWWSSYSDYIVTAGEIAERGKADRLSIGSELLTRETMRARWIKVIERVRLRYPRLELMYSANWDHYRPVRFWDLVDVMGLTGYWEIGKAAPRTEAALKAAWRTPLQDLQRFQALLNRPMVMTEVGYPSQEGALGFPWDETRHAPIDLEEQRLGYAALAHALEDAPFLEGVYIWNWFGFGGPTDDNYTPRNKPAGRLLTCWYRSASPKAGQVRPKLQLKQHLPPPRR